MGMPFHTYGKADRKQTKERAVGMFSLIHMGSLEAELYLRKVSRNREFEEAWWEPLAGRRRAKAYPSHRPIQRTAQAHLSRSDPAIPDSRVLRIE